MGEKRRPSGQPNTLSTVLLRGMALDFTVRKRRSGEIYDQTKFTAAHKTLPLGTKARVTNLDNGSAVEVEINDRGPFVEGRIIDLSRAAARALGFIESGTAPVHVELIAEETASNN